MILLAPAMIYRTPLESSSKFCKEFVFNRDLEVMPDACLKMEHETTAIFARQDDGTLTFRQIEHLLLAEIILPDSLYENVIFPFFRSKGFISFSPEWDCGTKPIVDGRITYEEGIFTGLSFVKNGLFPALKVPINDW